MLLPESLVIQHYLLLRRISFELCFIQHFFLLKTWKSPQWIFPKQTQPTHRILSQNYWKIFFFILSAFLSGAEGINLHQLLFLIQIFHLQLFSMNLLVNYTQKIFFWDYFTHEFRKPLKNFPQKKGNWKFFDEEIVFISDFWANQILYGM